MNGTTDQVDSNQENESKTESRALRSILGDKLSTNSFFQDIWQKQAVVFPFSGERHLSAGQGGDGNWNDDKMLESPLEEIIHQGWHVLIRLLQQSEQEQSANRSKEQPEEHEVPLLFQNRELKIAGQVESLYGTGPFAPYLDGCSVVLNHGDLLSPWIAALCQDLQKSFPHAYANSYLTPPNSQAVPPHADDRDVLVFQLVGSKDWQVYQSVPVPYPYPHEQVGKAGMKVPQDVLDGPLSISTTLRPGDVLYMPRGFVHEARCSDSLSFHVTVALATHDWTLAGIMSVATQSILTRTIDFRKSILPTTATATDMGNPKALQLQIEDAVRMIQQEVTAESIMGNLRSRFEKHNHRAFPLRMKLIHEARFPPKNGTSQPDDDDDIDIVVGPKAAKRISFTTTIRAATADERARVPIDATQPRGLNVREEIADAIMGIVSKMKSDPSIQCRVLDLRSLMPAPSSDPLVCDLALLCLAKRSIELGAFAVVNS
jgi:hypothetical protein